MFKKKKSVLSITKQTKLNKRLRIGTGIATVINFPDLISIAVTPGAENIIPRSDFRD